MSDPDQSPSASSGDTTWQPTPPYAPPPGYMHPAAPAQPPYGPPPGYAQPGTVAPAYAQPGAYAQPVGYGQQPVEPAAAAAPAASRASLGVIAFVLSLVAAVGTSLVVALATWQIGSGSQVFPALIGDVPFNWGMLSPVRGWVLTGEIAFWTGTILGIAALVVGIIAIVKNRSRVFAIIAVVIAVLGPTVFFVALQAALVAGSSL